MRKVVVYQSPAFLYEVAPLFYKELNKMGYFDQFYLATDKKETYGLGKNVHVLNLEKDYGWEGNLQRVLKEVPEDLFVMMCDDHVTVDQDTINLDKYFEIMQKNPQIGRLQLSPPTLNYARFLRAHRLPVVVADDAKDWYPYDKRFRWHLNFQPSIWRKDFLQYVIEGGGNKSQLEIRASERARNHPTYISAYISDHAVRYQNFYASCQVHHTDPSFRTKKKAPHYREEFATYALENNIELDSNKRVHVRHKDLRGASVPWDYYRQHPGDIEALRKFEMRRSFVAYKIFKLEKWVRARVAAYTSRSGW